MDEMFLATQGTRYVVPSVDNSFQALINSISAYLQRMLNFNSNTDYFWASYAFQDGTYGADFKIERFSAYINDILPIAIGLAGVIIGIKVVLKIFRRFSR